MLRGRQGQHPILFWSDSGEPDIDHFVLKKQYSGGNPIYIDPVTGPYTDPDIVINYGGIIEAEYWVKAVDVVDLSSPWSNKKTTTGFPTTTKQIADEKTSSELPEFFDLLSTYPNPFNPTTTIRYDLPEISFVTLRIYDFLGREIVTLINSREKAGYKNVSWNGTDRSGKPVASGMYIYQITTVSQESGKKFTYSRKMVLIK